MLEDTNIWMVYRHTSPSTKVYIGITKNSTVRRWGRNGNGYKKCILFYRAIQKYGWDNIKHEILFFNLSENKAKYLEVELIRHYKNLGISYNCTDGGDGYLGYHPSEKVKEGWSKKRKGRVITEEWRDKISKSLKGRVIPHEVSMKGALNAGKKCSKAVVQFTVRGEYINTFDNIKAAAEVFGKSHANSLSACCRGKVCSSYGYIWMFKEDYDNFISLGNIDEKIREKVDLYNSVQAHKRDSNTNLKGRLVSAESRSIPIQMLSLDGKPLQVFPSGAFIKKLYGYDDSYIRNCCKGKSNHAYGYKWKFITKEEYEKYKEAI